jgi:hypothetical protein
VPESDQLDWSVAVKAIVREFNELDVVALMIDLPEAGLVAGSVGTIVFVHREGVAFEVEFPNSARRRMYLVETVEREHLLKLHNLRLGEELVREHLEEEEKRWHDESGAT